MSPAFSHWEGNRCRPDHRVMYVPIALLHKSHAWPSLSVILWTWPVYALCNQRHKYRGWNFHTLIAIEMNDQILLAALKYLSCTIPPSTVFNIIFSICNSAVSAWGLKSKWYWNAVVKSNSQIERSQLLDLKESHLSFYPSKCFCSAHFNWNPCIKTNLLLVTLFSGLQKPIISSSDILYTWQF